MVPDRVPPLGPGEKYRGYELAKSISAMVRKLNLLNRVFVVSRDAFKLNYLSGVDPDIPLGWLMDAGMFESDVATKVKQEYADIPDLYIENCFDNATTPHNFDFMKYLLTTGMVAKAINASFVDLAPTIYNDKKYYQNSKYSTLRSLISANYGSKVSMGLYKLFNVEDSNPGSEASKTADTKLLKEYVDKGIERIVTTDVNRVKAALDQTVIPSGRGSFLHAYVSTILLAFVIVKAIGMILFC